MTVATFRRPAALRALLDGLAALHPPDGMTVGIVVVDNDPGGSARPVAGRWAGPFPLRYEIEPHPGISAARNRAVELARGARYVAFVDDDEVPRPGWLRSLVAAARRWEADLVTGPVESSFAEAPPAWVVESAVHRRVSAASGTVLERAATNNLLVSARVLDALDPPFDARFGISGGSDTLFTMQARRAGYRIVWADDAVVDEVVPPERSRVSWVLRRGIRIGNTTARCEIALAGSRGRRAAVRLRHAGFGLRAALGGVVKVVAGLARRQMAAALVGARQATWGMGMAAGGLGLTYSEYRRRH